MELPSAVVFDLDGTLLDSLDDIALAAEEALTLHGFAVQGRESLRGMVGDGARSLVARALGLPTDEPRVTPVLATFLACYSAAPTRATRHLPGARELLATLTARGVPVAICTNKPGPLARSIVTQLLGPLPCIGGGDVAELKPHPAPVLAALSMLSVSADPKAWMVGDSAQDIEAGRRAGLTTWAISGGYGGERQLLGAKADHRVEDLWALCAHLEACVT